MKARALTCPSCGASLSFDENHTKVTCRFCGVQSVLVAEDGDSRAPGAEAVAGYPESFFEVALAAADPSVLTDLCAHYVELAKAYVESDQSPDEAFMRAIEKTVDVTERGKAAFRKEVMNYVGALSIEDRPFEYRTSVKLHRALAAYLHLQNSPNN